MPEKTPFDANRGWILRLAGSPESETAEVFFAFRTPEGRMEAGVQYFRRSELSRYFHNAPSV